MDVRTQDPALQSSLRQNLGTLSNSLERAGYHAETFTPTTALRTASSAQMNNQDSSESNQNNNGAQDFNGGRRQQQKRQEDWQEVMENQQ